MKVYRVTNWDGNFENNRTRSLTNMHWVPVPNKHDGDGFTELMDHKNGMAHYAAWMLIVQVASKCRERGTLLRDTDKPYDISTLARVTRGKKDIFEEALPRLVAIGWIEEDEVVSACESIDGMKVPQDGTKVPDECASSTKNRTEGKEQKGTEVGCAEAGAVLLLTYLNEKAGRNFEDCEDNLKRIRSRVEDCHGDVTGCQQMIDRQVALWKGDPEMEEYLRPKTLFAKDNFRSYYDDRSRAVTPKAHGRNGNRPTQTFIPGTGNL